MSPPRAVTILEESRVSPPPESVPATSLPLTFFDLLWHRCCPIQRLYFYQFPHSSHHFSHAIVPSLKRSLSLALRSFFPFAGNLTCPPPPATPCLRFCPGDSVPFTAAECHGDFLSLLADVRQIRPFAPTLPPPSRAEGSARVVPLMAVQVTSVSGLGIAVGVTFCHVAADGRSFHHFVKSWASVCKAGGDPAAVEIPAPFHGRDPMKALDGLGAGRVKKLWAWASALEDNPDPGPTEDKLSGKVRATFVLSRARIESLKRFVRIRRGGDTEDVSAFVATCALVWVCVIKSEAKDRDKDKDEPCFFTFLADCRNRLDFPIPNTYFGNCLTFSAASVAKSELAGENGMVEAAKAIGAKVRELESGALDGIENWRENKKEIIAKNYRVVTLAGTPKLGIYETDFGWGRPKKTELVHTDVSGAISLCDHRGDEHGIEVGLVLSEPQMVRFGAIFEESLNLVV